MVSNDDSLAVQDWTAYEKTMIEFLREERRRGLGAAPGKPAPTPTESPPQDSPCPEPAPTRPASSQQDAPEQSDPPLFSGQAWQNDQPGQSAAVPLQQDRAPADLAPTLYVQPARHRRSRLRITLLGSSLFVIVAGAAAVILKPYATSNEVPPASLEATAPQEQIVQKNSGTAINRMEKSADRAGIGSHEVLGNRVRLRSTPAVTGSVLLTVSQGAFVRIKEHPAESEWCLIQLPGGPEGWMKCDFLKMLPESGPGPTPQH